MVSVKVNDELLLALCPVASKNIIEKKIKKSVFAIVGYVLKEVTFNRVLKI
jgi:hypothetical protein